MTKLHTLALLFVTAVAIGALGCTTQPASNSNSVSTSAPSPSPVATSSVKPETLAVTLPVLNAMFSDDTFKTELKSKLQLTDEQINALQKNAGDEVARLRASNAEEQDGSATDARERAAGAIRNAIGDQKADAVFALVNEHWVKGSEEPEAAGDKTPEITMLTGPNAIPPDSRIVVNIPAFRMDLFSDGKLVKSYKVGIGYPQFPLPTGLRKAQQIIFNPTWTPPDEPWVASMKDIKVGEKVEAGSSLNPLGPIKIPIGMPSLIHGGKSPAKIGNFASHGCVGLTNPQVKDFAKLLAQSAGTDVSDKTIENYLRDKTRTRTVKLGKVMPVELRYETIVLEDGKLYIYKDVYDRDTNTEENLRSVLQTNGASLDDLSNDEKAAVLEALNAMSAHPKKIAPKPANTNSPETANSQANSTGKKGKVEKPATRNKRERAIEIASLSGKGYPAPVDLDTGTGKPSPQAKTAAR
jgi:lipoprotein-anchoring transpeptidase ErfK/SrfK